LSHADQQATRALLLSLARDFSNVLIERNFELAVPRYLCLAVASCIILAIPRDWPDPLREIIGAPFQGTPVSGTYQGAYVGVCSVQLPLPSAAALLVLALLPEQLEQMDLTQPHREQVSEVFRGTLDVVLPFLVQHLRGDVGSPLTGLALQALHAWVDFGLPLMYASYCHTCITYSGASMSGICLTPLLSRS